MSVKDYSFDFRRFLEHAPGAFFVVLPDLTIVAATDEFLRMTGRRREDLVGRGVFEAFPDNPDEETTNSVQVRASFLKVLETGEPNELPVQKYDVRRSAEDGGGFEERYWRLVTIPGFDENGKVVFMYQRVENFTGQVKTEKAHSTQENLNAELTARAEKSETEQKKTAAALEDVQIQLEAALIAGEIGTWTWDVVNDRVIADNNLAKFFSVSEKDAQGGKIEKYLAAIHPKDIAGIKKIIGDALENGESYEAEYRLINPDRTIRRVVARGRVLRDAGGKVIQLPGVVIDITERREAQEQLLERANLATLSSDIGIGLNKREDLPSLLQHCTDAMVEHLDIAFARIWTLDENEQVLKLEASSGLYTHLDGAHSRVPVGQFKIGRIAELRRPHLTNEVLTDSEVSDKEWAAREKMVAFAGYPLIVEDKLVGVMCVFARRPLSEAILQTMGSFANKIANAIERKQIEKDLIESNERFQLVTRATNDAIWDWNLQTNEIWWNNAVHTMFGYTTAEIAKDSNWWKRHIHPDDRERVTSGIQNIIANGIENWSIEYRYLCSDGTYKYVLDRGFAIQRDDQPVRMIGAMQDITDRKLIESERERLLWNEREARAEAEQANRTKDEFLATLSHELRTPLSSILGWSRLLKEGQIAGEQAMRAVETIERNAKSQAQLIEDVLDVSRIISGKMRLEVQPVDLSFVIESAIDGIRPAADAKNIRLQRVTDSDVMIAGDADRLQQIIWNLLSNAIKFTPKEGRVQIKMERINSHVEVIITDNGMGIEPETLPFVFDRFRQSDSTTTRKYGGLGLGLAIVRHLVELHGGTVQAASDGINQGSTFTLFFPLIAVRSKEIPAVSEEENTERAHPTAGGDAPFVCPDEIKDLRILVVDDEPDTREMLLYIFTSCEAQPTGAASADEAWEKLRNDEFDVLVSDIGMPERDGYDLIKSVRLLPAEQSGRIPAVALTAYARVEDRLRALTCGFQMHVPKPVDPAELLAVVASLANWNNRKKTDLPGD